MTNNLYIVSACYKPHSHNPVSENVYVLVLHIEMHVCANQIVTFLSGVSKL